MGEKIQIADIKVKHKCISVNRKSRYWLLMLLFNIVKEILANPVGQTFLYTPNCSKFNKYLSDMPRTTLNNRQIKKNGKGDIPAQQ